MIPQQAAYDPGRIMDAQEGLCPYCARRLLGIGTTGRRHPNRWTRDHVVPRSAGAGRSGNILIVHGKCNRRKGGRPPTGCERLWLSLVNERLARGTQWRRWFRSRWLSAKAARELAA